MTNLEIAKIIAEITGNDIQIATRFFTNDCGIKGVNIIEDYITDNYIPYYDIYLYDNLIEGNVFCISEVKIIDIVQIILANMNKKDKEKVNLIVSDLLHRKIQNALPNINVSPIITTQANAQNTIDIKNLSELSAYVSNSSTITNKAEIQKALSALKEAKDGDSAESYIGLLINLVGLLCKDGVLPPFVGKLAGGLGKWFK